MDLIAQALVKRENLKAALARVDTFLAMAYELQGESVSRAPAKLDAEKIAEPIRRKSDARAPSGVGAKTAEIAESIVRQAGRAMSTRELVPLVQAHGIEIGGKDSVATLSARLGNDAKRSDARLQLKAGKWHLTNEISDADNEEAAGIPTKATPTASLFTQTKEDDDAAALAS